MALVVDPVSLVPRLGIIFLLRRTRNIFLTVISRIQTIGSIEKVDLRYFRRNLISFTGIEA